MKNKITFSPSVIEAYRNAPQPPFLVDRVGDPFRAYFRDLEQFNSSAYHAVLREIQGVNRSQARQSRGLLILGEAGTGKTHLLARIYNKLKGQNCMLWVSNPGNPEAIFSFTWTQIFKSLGEKSGSTNTQAEELLSRAFAGLLERSLKLDNQNSDYWDRQIWRVRNGEALGNEIERVRNRIVTHWQQSISSTSIDINLLKGLFNFLVYQDNYRRGVIFESLTDYEFDSNGAEQQIGLQKWTDIQIDSSASDLVGKREAWALRAIRLISELATIADRPMILAFDQLEWMRNNFELTKAWGNAVKQIVDEARNLVVVTCIFPSLWQDWFTKDQEDYGPPLDVASQDRIAQNTVALDKLDADLSKKLIHARLRDLGPEIQSEIESSLTEEVISSILSQAGEGLSPRKLLRFCHHLFEEAGVESEKQTGGLEQLFETYFSAVQLPKVAESEDHQVKRIEELGEKLLLGTKFKIDKFQRRSGKRVLPAHFFLKHTRSDGTVQRFVLGLINRNGVSLTSRLRNWRELCLKEPTLIPFLFRSSLAKRPKHETQSASLLSELKVDVLPEEIERRVLGYYEAATAVLEKELEFNGSYVEVADVRNLFLQKDLPRFGKVLKIDSNEEVQAGPTSPPVPAPPKPIPPPESDPSGTVERPFLPPGPIQFIPEASRDEVLEIMGRIKDFCTEFDMPINTDSLTLGGEISAPHVVTLNYERKRGGEAKHIEKFGKDLSLSLKRNCRIYSNVPLGKFSIEVERNPRAKWDLKDALLSMNRSKDPTEGILVPIGINAHGIFMRCNLKKSPNLLVGGSSGSGKTNFLKSMIATLMTRYSPSEVQLNICDPKRIDFSLFRRLKTGHISAFATETSEIVSTLEGILRDMNERYELMEARGIDNFSDLKGSEFPCIITIVDEVADLGMDNKEAMALIQRIAQKGRAAGIFLVLATQYPTVKTIPSEVKVNLNTRIAFKLQSSDQSNVVIDQDGAEALVPPGDCLFKAADSSVVHRCLIPEFSKDFEAWFVSTISKGGAKTPLLATGGKPSPQELDRVQGDSPLPNETKWKISREIFENISEWNRQSRLMTNSRELLMLGNLDKVSYSLGLGYRVERDLIKHAEMAVERAIYLGFNPAKIYKAAA